MSTNVTIEQPRLLIVEGSHERDVVSHLLAARQIAAGDLQILPIGGKNTLQRNLRALRSDPSFPRVAALGIMRDADLSGPGARAAGALAFEAVCGCLRNSRLPVPTRHAEFAAGPPRVGIFIAPNGTDDGMLETLCVRSVASTAPFTCVTAFFDCLAEQGLTPTNAPKAQAHAFIASCPDPECHIGIAARKGYWDLQHSAFDELAAFVAAI